MDVNKCLDDAWSGYQDELQTIQDMGQTGEVGEDETWRMKKIAFDIYSENVERCYQEFEGRSTPGRGRK